MKGYKFGDDISVHRYIHDPDNWYVSSVKFGFNRDVLCPASKSEGEVLSALLKALTRKRNELDKAVAAVNKEVNQVVINIARELV